MSSLRRAKKTPSLGVLHPTFERWGGAEWFTHGLLNAFVEHDGIDVTVYTHRWNAPPEASIRFEVEEHQDGGVFSGPADWRAIAARYEKRWRRHDVLLVGNYPAACWYAFRNRTLRDLSAVWYCHEPPVQLYGASRARMVPGASSIGRVFEVRGQPPGRRLARLARRGWLAVESRLLGDQRWRERLRRQDAATVGSLAEIVCNSAFTAGRVSDIYGRESTVAYPIPADIGDFIAPRGGSNKRDVVLWVGRLVPEKRPELLVEAWGRACTLNPKLSAFSLVMVGDGPLHRRIHEMSDELPKQARAKIVGAVPRRRLIELYQVARLTVFLGEAEPFGMVPVESMFAGTPVLSTCEGGAAETIQPGVTGVCVAATAGDLACELSGVPDQRAELELLGRRAREAARSTFDFGRTCERILRVLDTARDSAPLFSIRRGACGASGEMHGST